MNYLAHLYFSQPTPASRVGNLLGDFRRGVTSETLPNEVRAGLRNHLAVDAFTDSHPLIHEAKRGFSSQRRRFAGVALDVLFDHLLIRHWHQFSDTGFDSFIDDVYGDLARGERLMPAPMRRRVELMTAQDWLRAYGSLDTVALALDRMAARIRFTNGFAGVMDEMLPREQELEARFLAFFPELCRHVAHHGIESVPAP